MKWSDAVTAVANLSHGMCGLMDQSWPGDWRLPTKTEFMAMYASARNQGYMYPVLTNTAGTGHWTEGDPFQNLQASYYWSSELSGYAWRWNVWYGDLVITSISSEDLYYVWPVRADQ